MEINQPNLFQGLPSCIVKQSIQSYLQKHVYIQKTSRELAHKVTKDATTRLLSDKHDSSSCIITLEKEKPLKKRKCSSTLKSFNFPFVENFDLQTSLNKFS